MIQLRKYRKQVGLTQDELAYKVGVNMSTISYWENSITSPTIPQCERLAKILNVKPQQIAGWSE